MKKNSLVVALPILIISLWSLSGCGMTRSHKEWEMAQQESPLEIPPGLDTPATREALAIPPAGANRPTAHGVTAQVGDVPGVITDGFMLSLGVEKAYRRIGALLQSEHIARISAHDDVAHSYALTVRTLAPSKKEKHGFFGRLFGRDKRPSHRDIASAKPGMGEQQVQLTVTAASDNAASEVRAQGVPVAVAKVIDGLRAGLGIKQP
jgi:uncharacterized lipoprotein